MRYNLLELLILGFLNNISDIGLEIMLISARVSVFYLLVENIVSCNLVLWISFLLSSSFSSKGFSCSAVEFLTLNYTSLPVWLIKSLVEIEVLVEMINNYFQSLSSFSCENTMFHLNKLI